jgi:hypothetical protein
MNGEESGMERLIETTGDRAGNAAIRYIFFLVVAVVCPKEFAGAQTFRMQGGGAAWFSDRRSPLSTQLSRTGLHKPIPPGEITSDTLWFLPPAVSGDPQNPVLTRIIRNASVQLDSVTFPDDRMLDISLVHAGCNDTLVHGLTNSGSDFIRTAFADSAAVSIIDGIPPFSGEFAPTKPLSQFTGRDATGSYIVQIFNHSALATGTLEDWSIALDFATVFTSAGAGPADMPDRFLLFQNFPNPFNPSTTIRFAIPQRSRVTLALFDLLGRHVATLLEGEEEAGYHQVRFDGSNLASGIYFCRFTAGDFAAMKRLLLLR